MIEDDLSWTDVRRVIGDDLSWTDVRRVVGDDLSSTYVFQSSVRASLVTAVSSSVESTIRLFTCRVFVTVQCLS